MHVCGSPTNISPNWVTQLATQAYRENLHITIKPKEMRFGWKGREDWIGGWLALGTPQVLFLLYKKRTWEIGTNQPWFTMSTVKSLYKFISLPPKWIGLYQHLLLATALVLFTKVDQHLQFATTHIPLCRANESSPLQLIQQATFLR